MRKVIIIGFDGATFDLLEPWIDAGYLPNLARMRSTGTSGELESLIPPSTAPAWVSFATGKNPGKHGIFEFMRMEENDYRIAHINAESVASKTLWDIVSESGQRVISLNVPISYPPRPINGLMVTGIITPGSAREFTYPPEFRDRLRTDYPDYHIMHREAYAEGQEELFIDELHRILDYKTALALELMEQEKWDLFIQVFNESDTIQHALWRFIDPDYPQVDQDGQERYGSAILQLYQKLDVFIGQVLEKVDDNTVLMIVSDHGSGPLHKVVHNNNWLLKNGFLKTMPGPKAQLKYQLFLRGLTPLAVYGRFARTPFFRFFRMGDRRRQIKRNRMASHILAKGFFSFYDIDWSRSRVYSLGGGHVGMFSVNLRGREPRGIVDPGEEFESVREELIECLQDLRDPETGERIVGKILKREELYEGPYASMGPDLVYFPKDHTYAIFSNFGFSSNEVVETVPPHIAAQHRMNGIFFAWGPGVRESQKIEGARLIDIAPTVLHLLDIPVSQEMDGHVLEKVFLPTYLLSWPIRYTDDAYQRNRSETSYSESEEKQIEERLRGLGYLA